MEGLAKTAETQQPQEQQKRETKEGLLTNESKIHPEVYKYFNANPSGDSTSKEKLKAVNDWAFGDSKTLSQSLRKIKGLERKLGAPKLGQSRVDKLFNWVRMTNNINETKTEMGKELEKIQLSKQKNVEQVKDNFKPGLEKLNNQIKEKEKSYRRAIATFKRDATDRTKYLKEQYQKQLKELKEIRKAYGGR